MNILEINTIDNRGGAPRIAYSLKETLKKRGHSAVIYSKYKYSKDPEVFEMRWPNLLTRLGKKLTGKDLGSVLSARLHRLFATDIEWFNTDKLLQTREFKSCDLVHCHNLHGNYFRLSTLTKISKFKPIVWTLHDMWSITAHCGHAYEGKLKDGFFECPSLNTYQDLLWNNQRHLMETKRQVYHQADFHIVVPCLWLKLKVEQSILKDHPVSLIYNGIDENVFKPTDKAGARRQIGLPLNKKIVLFASSRGADEEKGGKYLFEIVRKFANRPDILFVCIGQKAEGASFQSPNLLYFDFISDQPRLAEFYSACDVFLFSSLAETFPLVVLESMSCGLPVVSFDVGGVQEAFEHKKQGYLAKYRDSDDLTSGIEFMINLKPDDYASFSSGARHRVLEKFTLDSMVNKYLELYNSEITRFKARVPAASASSR